MSPNRLKPPPGPRGLDVLRFFGGGSFAKTLAYFEDVAQRYGPIASFRILGRRLHLVTGPQLVRDVLVVQQAAFTRANGAAILRDLLGQSVLTLDEPGHRERRHILRPAFHTRRITAHAGQMTDEAERLCAGWDDGEAIDMGAAMTRLALAIVSRSLFGFDAGESADALDRVLTPAMRTVSWLGPILEALPLWANDVRLRLPLRANARLAAARAQIAMIVNAAVDVRSVAHDRDTVLSTLLDARDAAGEALPAHAVADELATILLAGHETTANALAWAWHALARDAALQNRMHAEVEAAWDEPGTPPDLARLRFTSSVFAEALRLYPPASAFGRRALRDCTLGGYAVRAGDGIVLSPYVSHRNAEVFREPQRFIPDRWNAAAFTPFAYFPFGGGSRVCIGEAFARMEGTLVLATLARRFAFSPRDDGPIGIAGHATLRPARPIVVYALRRQSFPRL